MSTQQSISMPNSMRLDCVHYTFAVAESVVLCVSAEYPSAVLCVSAECCVVSGGTSRASTVRRG